MPQSKRWSICSPPLDAAASHCCTRLVKQAFGKNLAIGALQRPFATQDRFGVTKRHGGAVAGTAEVLTYLTETLQRSERGKSAKSRHLASFCSDN
jgi:hypothetical protein